MLKTRVARVLSLSFLVPAAVALVPVTAAYADEKAFYLSNAPQTWVVPPGVFQVTVDVRGAAGGGDANCAYEGGRGGQVRGVLPVTPGETLTILVGGKGREPDGRIGGAGGFNGGGRGGSTTDIERIGAGGGGGASDIRRAGVRLTVGAGGGGGAWCNVAGGAGGGLTGGTGAGISGYSGGGAGGSQSAGGAGGAAGSTLSVRGGMGAGGVGGAGGNGGGAYASGGGGGGGGYYGGGGGGGGANAPGTGAGGGGGGGSSYADRGMSGVTHSSGIRSGDGLVVLTWSLTGGSQCSDLLDNDDDGRADFPADPGCSSPTDVQEQDDQVGCPPITPGAVLCLVHGPEIAQYEVGTTTPAMEFGAVGYLDAYEFTAAGIRVTLPCVVLVADARTANACSAAGGRFVSRTAVLVNRSVGVPGISTDEPLAVVTVCEATLTATVAGFGVNSAPVYTLC